MKYHCLFEIQINMKTKFLIVLAVLFAFVASCKKDPLYQNTDKGTTDQNGWVYDPTPQPLVIPNGFPSASTPADNPQTVQGIKLGRMLFYDPLLSGDSTQACASCHQQQFAFSDGNGRFSRGINGQLGTRNAPPLFNLIYSNKFFWDGRAESIEDQALQPVVNPIEMASNWDTVVKRLKRSNFYPKLFYEAFGKEKDSITPQLTAKAIAQFLRTIISANSRFDQQKNGAFTLTSDEIDGYNVFLDSRGGDCFHCHGDGDGNRTFMELNPTGQFRNNGLQPAHSEADFQDSGLGKITGVYKDFGKMKIPSLRNLAFTGPYMHDGRFATLQEVVDFYSTGVNNTPFTDPNMQFASQGGVNLSATDKGKLIAFLQSLNDSSLITNPDFSNPFQ